MSDDDPYRRNTAAPAALVALAAGADAKRRELPRDAQRLTSRRRRVERALDVRSVPGLATVICVAVAAPFVVVGGIAGSMLSVIVGVLLVPTGFNIDVALARSNRAVVAKELARGSRQPFAVDGYDLWLASERPLFDVTLRADVEQRVVTDAVAAIDPEIAIEWLGPRVFRVAIPARRFGSDEVMYVGDRAGWLRFADQILAPLHADLGIERVEMGGSMRALPP